MIVSLQSLVYDQRSKLSNFYNKQVKIIFQITIKNKELDLACHQWIILFISAVLHALLTHLQLPISPALLDSILDYCPISCIISEFESTTLVSFVFAHIVIVFFYESNVVTIYLILIDASYRIRYSNKCISVVHNTCNLVCDT